MQYLARMTTESLDVLRKCRNSKGVKVVKLNYQTIKQLDDLGLVMFDVIDYRHPSERYAKITELGKAMIRILENSQQAIKYQDARRYRGKRDDHKVKRDAYGRTADDGVI